MGSDTTIPVSHGTKELLDAEKRAGETWDAALRRLVAAESPDEEVMDALRALEEQVNRLPDRTADELQTRLR